jgi:hypothetical protein
MKSKHTFTPPRKITAFLLVGVLVLSSAGCSGSASDSNSVESTSAYCSDLPTFTTEKKFWSYVDQNIPVITLADISGGAYNGSYVLIDSVILGSYCKSSKSSSDGYDHIECRPAFATGDASYTEYYFYIAPSLAPDFQYGTSYATEMQKNDLVRWCLLLNENGSFTENSIIGLKKIGTEANPTLVTPEPVSESAPDSPESATSTESVASDPDSADSRLKNATVFTADVYSGTGAEIVGQRAYVILPKDALLELTADGFTQFVNTVVKDSGYNWFSIICDDGTGINFSGSIYSFATYGELDSEGGITSPIGYITLSENGYVYESIN